MGTSGNMPTSNNYVKYTISIYQNSQSVSGNYSNVTVSVRFFRTNTGYSTYGCGTCYCKINGSTYSATVNSSQKITNSGIILFSKTLDIYHNADGSKYLDTYAWISLNTPLSSNEQWYGEWLSTIPRTSSISSINGDTFGSPITVNISRASSLFTHNVIYERPDGNRFTVGESISTSCTFTPDLSDSNYIPNSTSGSAKITVDTYSGSTYIGSTTNTFTIYVPSSVVPTINSVNLSEAISGISSQFGGYVQGKSKISGNINASGIYSSTIKSYSVNINGASYTSSSFTTDFLASSDTNSCSVKITDSRGRTASKNITFNVLSYFSPLINSFSVSRCNSDGSANDEGSYAKCSISSSISSVNNKNTKEFKIMYKKVSVTSWNTVTLSTSNYSIDTTRIIQNIDTESEYNFKILATDFFGFSEYSHNLSTAYTLMDFNKNGKGMAIGKVSTQSALEINMDTKLTGSFTINGKTIFDLIYPVGSIYLSIKNINPGNLFGGTWVGWGQGRVPVGVASSGTFNYSEKTGGSETHTLTTSQMPSHEGHIPGSSYCWGNAGEDTYFANLYSNAFSQYGRDRPWVLRAGNEVCLRSNYIGGGNAHNNLQPYITCYMWKRTA